VSPIKESDDKLADVGASAAMAELQDIRDSIDNIDASHPHVGGALPVYPEGWSLEGSAPLAAV
jgi:hypothetical protein